jgi:tetratricopeptide (TPR) repeat protein
LVSAKITSEIISSRWKTNRRPWKFYNNIGISYDNLHDHKNAIEYKQQSLAIFLKLFGENHADVADGYTCIGISYYNLGDHKQALEY